MAEQLDRLITATSRQRVSLGIIPARPGRAQWPTAPFWIYDDRPGPADPSVTRAVALWRALGFEVVAPLPGALSTRFTGYVGLHIMYL